MTRCLFRALNGIGTIEGLSAQASELGDNGADSTVQAIVHTVQISCANNMPSGRKLDSFLCTAILGFSSRWTRGQRPSDARIPETASTVHVQRKLSTTCATGALIVYS